MQRGFIVAIFSIVAIIVGLAAAIKLSAVAAEYLKDSINISAQWLPVISFLVVFIGVMLLVRLGANLLQKTVELAFLGWVNRVAGALLYVLLYTIVFSILLFYIVQLNIINKDTIAASKTYPYIEPVGPYVINLLGMIIPFFRDMFEQLKSFFETFDTVPAKH